MATQEELDAYFAWRDEQGKRPRIMTQSEYAAWRLGGDVISSPHSSNAFRGGLTISFETPLIIGKFADGPSVQPPVFDTLPAKKSGAL